MQDLCGLRGFFFCLTVKRPREAHTFFLFLPLFGHIFGSGVDSSRNYLVAYLAFSIIIPSLTVRENKNARFP